MVIVSAQHLNALGMPCGCGVSRDLDADLPRITSGDGRPLPLVGRAVVVQWPRSDRATEALAGRARFEAAYSPMNAIYGCSTRS